MTGADSQPAAPRPVTPQPVPLALAVNTARDPSGRVWVVLQVSSPTGTGVYFFEPDSAVAAGVALAGAGREATSGLTVVEGLARP